MRFRSGTRDDIQRTGRREAAHDHRLWRIRGAVQNRRQHSVVERWRRGRWTSQPGQQTVQKAGTALAARAQSTEKHWY